ncbi:hypothetical protein P43SY_004400 [Pythium insidiosum]|uniref:ATP-dependent RNA helicase n=1 Tax=Pythium insidiosum TaxID=114742 RepID=A0AAD5M886_PYTIN|nr:hypothetical protein P43SY_004400 [Pythium insidiosum]
MGVRGLASYCYQHEQQTALVFEKLRNVTLAVDLVSFQFFACEEAAKHLEAKTHIPTATWLLLGGCPRRLEQWLDAWLDRLQPANISLVFVADPPQCFLGRDHYKSLELLDRAQQKRDKMQQLRSKLLTLEPSPRRSADGAPAEMLCRTRSDAKALLQDVQSVFPLARETIRRVLRQRGCRVITADREADEVLGDLVRTQQAFAVLSNDSDFMCMRGVRYIPFHKLRIDDKSRVVTARVFADELVAGSLQISTDALVDLALLCTNDFTPQLDAAFDLARCLGFPRPSGGARGSKNYDGITPELAALCIQGRRTTILDDPRLDELARRHPAFPAALHKMYRFYGYDAEFRRRFAVPPDTRVLAPGKMETYCQLLDRYDVSTSVIDVMCWQSRKIKQEVDVLSIIVPGASLVDVLAPARVLLYHTLDVLKVREFSMATTTGERREVDVTINRLPQLSRFLASRPLNSRDPVEMEEAWRALIFYIVYADPGGRENASFMWKLLGKGPMATPALHNVVSALLVLWSCASRYRPPTPLPAPGQLVTMEVLDVLLLTALICGSLRPGQKLEPFDLDINLSLESLPWHMYVSSTAFLETLRALHFARIMLGDTTSRSQSPLVSAEVLLPVFMIVTNTRSGQHQTARDRSGLSRAQVDSVLVFYTHQLRADAREQLWDTYCQLRGILYRLVELAVGYRIGQNQNANEGTTRITYVTTGYMLERLIHRRDTLSEITHLVIDEVHERSMDVDALLLLLKLQLHEHSHVRLVIMSATMDARVLIKYFANSLSTKLLRRQPLFVGAKLFPVDNLYLDDLAQAYPQLMRRHQKDVQRAADWFRRVEQTRSSASSEVGVGIINSVHECQLRIIPTLIQQLITEHHGAKGASSSTDNSSLPPQQCILVFLPGLNSITRLYEELTMAQASRVDGVSVMVTVLHSTLELEEQQLSFAALSASRATKVVLATNIAESSVTLPDVTHVINCGLEKQLFMPDSANTNVEVLREVWCSRASVLQRAGRAGRVMPGVAVHLFGEGFMTACMAEFTTPEILRKPLDRIVLQLKARMNEFGTPSALLLQALDSPDLQQITGAYKLLADHDALDSKDEAQANITPFGNFVSYMPLPMPLCRLLLSSSVARTPHGGPMLPLAVILVAILATPDVFVTPSWYHATTAMQFLSDMKASLRGRLAVDSGIWSEPLGVWRLYVHLLCEHTTTTRPPLAVILKSLNISQRRFKAVNMLITDLCARLRGDVHHPRLPSIDSTTAILLQQLEKYSSGHAVDMNLVAYAQQAVRGDLFPQETRELLDVLRFMVVQNYSDQLIGGFVEPTKDDGDEMIVDTSDRIDLAVVKEYLPALRSLSNQERRELVAQTSSRNVDDAADISLIELGGDVLSIHTRVLRDDPGSSGSIYGHVVQHLSFPVSLLHYLRDQRYPIFLGRTGESEDSEQKFRFRLRDCSGTAVSWAQLKDDARVSIGNRSLFTLPLRPTAISSTEQRLEAVYVDRLLTGDETRMMCYKCTLLPPDSLTYLLVLRLLSLRGGEGTGSLWVFCDEKTGDIASIKDKRALSMPSHTYLKADVIHKINKLRAALSRAQQTAADVEPLSAASIIAVCRDDDLVVQDSKENSHARNLEWRQLVPAPGNSTTGAPMRFPPLVFV